MIIFVQSNDGSCVIPDNIKFIRLCHPKSGIEMTYAVVDHVLMEIQSVQPRRHGSWFVDQRVSSDSSIYLASPIDPRFLVLPALEKSSARYCPLNQIITNAIPLEGSTKWKLFEICDINDKLGDDMIFYRFNEAKTFVWLKDKVDRTAKVLTSQRRKQSSEKCTVSSFHNSVQSSKSTTQQQRASSTNSDISEQTAGIYTH